MVKPLTVNTVELGSALERVEAPSHAGEAHGANFGDTLANAINEVDKLQLAADGEAEKAAMGAGNLHELSLSLEKADVAMRVATKVRNKVVEAYHEIMRMSV